MTKIIKIKSKKEFLKVFPSLKYGDTLFWDEDKFFLPENPTKTDYCNKTLIEYLSKIELKKRIPTHLKLAYLYYSQYMIDKKLETFQLSKHVKVLNDLRFMKRDILQGNSDISYINKRLVLEFNLQLIVEGEEIFLYYKNSEEEFLNSLKNE